MGRELLTGKRYMDIFIKGSESRASSDSMGIVGIHILQIIFSMGEVCFINVTCLSVNWKCCLLHTSSSSLPLFPCLFVFMAGKDPCLFLFLGLGTCLGQGGEEKCCIDAEDVPVSILVCCHFLPGVLLLLLFLG